MSICIQKFVRTKRIRKKQLTKKEPPSFNYGEYQSWNHIQSGLNLLKNIPDVSLEQKISWLYHDIIYDIKSNQNEYLSSLKALEDIKLNRDNNKIDVNIVSIIINDTKNHIPSIKESEIILDIDMSSLAIKNYEDFVALRILAASEYSSFGKYLVIQGTKKFISEILNQDKIFYSEYFSYMNEIAFNNLKKYYNEFEKNKNFLDIFENKTTPKSKIKL